LKVLRDRDFSVTLQRSSHALIRRWITAIVFAASLSAVAQTPKEYDLLVYGATAGGIATAVAARRDGASVALVDPGHHIGGLVAGGLSSSDHGNVAAVGGISREFFEAVGHHYGESIEWNFEPHVATAVFESMLRDAHIDTFFNSPLSEKGVEKKNGRILGIHTTNGKYFRARIFADCSYEGELMGLAGVSYTWGRESESTYHESLAGVRGPQRKDHLFTVHVSPYGADGKLLPEVQPGEPGAIGTGDKKVQAYGFRMCITQQADNQIPFPKPDHYDPARYEILARLVEALTVAKARPPYFREMIIMSKLKGDKYDINSLGAASTDHIGGSWGFPTANAQQRQTIWHEHYEYEAGFFYFLGHSDRIPPQLRDEVNSYGLAKDEFSDTEGWPWQLYIRESRRMVGEYLMTQHDIQDNITKPDSIGMGSYQSDSHGVERIATADGGTQNEGEMYVPTRPYQIPYRLILPKRSEVSNLLVPVCFSASHVAYSTLRMEPQYMIIGQAAGVAAAMAVHNHTSIYDISVPALQQRLIGEHAVLQLPQEKD
jgi:FAD dependent oxidoreductase